MAVNPFPPSGSITFPPLLNAHAVPFPKPKLLAEKKSAMDHKIGELRQRRADIAQGGGQQRIEKQHAAGKLTARERVEKLVDRGSFQEIGGFAKHRATYFGMAEKETPADGVVTGCAMVDGRLVHLASQDFTVCGGTAGETHCAKITEMMQLSLKTGSPFVFINDSGGARVQEGIDSLAGYASVFYNNVLLSGSVPQISLICGPCAGGAAYSPALTDFIIQTKTSAAIHYGTAGHQAGHWRSGDQRRIGWSRGADEPLWCGSPYRGR